MYLYDDWRVVFTLRPVTTLGGRVVSMKHVERRVWMAHGEVKHKEYRMPLHRPHPSGVTAAPTPNPDNPDVCQGCGAIEKNGEAHNHKCPNGVDVPHPANRAARIYMDPQAVRERNAGVPACDPTKTECPRCKNDISKCDGAYGVKTCGEGQQ